MSPIITCRQPIAVLRLVQLPLCVLSFALVVTYSGCFQLTMKCPDGTTTLTDSGCWHYPFKKATLSIEASCTQKTPVAVRYDQSLQSPTLFFVAVGVLTFFFCLAMLLIYFIFWSSYESSDKLIYADFAVTFVLALFWLCASAAWCSAVIDLREQLGKHRLQYLLAFAADEDCVDRITPSGQLIFDTKKCTVTAPTQFTSLNFSVVAGFVMHIILMITLYFVLKLTPWFKQGRLPDLGRFNPTTEPAERVRNSYQQF